MPTLERPQRSHKLDLKSGKPAMITREAEAGGAKWDPASKQVK